MNPKTTLTALGIMTLILAAACGAKTDSEEATATAPANTEAVYRTLAIEELADILDTRPDDYTIINVHIPYAGEIDGTDANIPFDDIDALTGAIPDKNAPVILYCRSGNMSEQASRALVELGYTQVWDVPGGMYAWQSSGRELVDKAQ